MRESIGPEKERIDSSRKPTDLQEQNAQLQRVLLKSLEAVFILIASLLLLLKIPYFPISLSVVLSFVVAALSYNNSSRALLLLFLLAIPGYIYQGGFPPLMVGIVGGILFIVAVSCSGIPGAALGIAAGIIAAMLMFTTHYYLAIPLFLGVALFRTRGIKVGSTEAIAVFMVFYLPFLVADEAIASSTGLAPLFQQVEFTVKNPTPVIELTQIFNQLGESLGTNPSIVDNMAVYWPIHGGGRLLGFVLLFSLAAAIATAFGCLALINWLKQWLVEHRYLNWWAPIFALLVANMVFLLPITILKSAFVYDVDLGVGTVFGFIGATIVIGNVGSAIEQWLNRRERLIMLRIKFENRAPEIRRLCSNLNRKITSVKEACPKLDLFAERSLEERCQQELAFAMVNLGEMDPMTLSEKLNLLTQMETQIIRADESVRPKLLRHIEDSQHEYESFTRQVSEYGLSLNNMEGEVESVGKDFPDDESALEEQHRLNRLFEELGQALVSSSTEISRTINNEVDPDFVILSIDIARNYLNSGSYEEAIETALSALSTMDRMVTDAAVGLTSRLGTAIESLETTIGTSVIPIVDSIGDSELAQGFYTEFAKLHELRPPTQQNSRLIDLLEVIRLTRQLANWAATMRNLLLGKIRALEHEIDSIVPDEYVWGKGGPTVQGNEIHYGKSGNHEGKTSLNNSMTAIEAAIRSMENEATIIKQYMNVREFVINYPNIEYLVEEKLRTRGKVRVEELPVVGSYSIRYLQLYAQKNYREVSFDPRTGTLSYRER